MKLSIVLGIAAAGAISASPAAISNVHVPFFGGYTPPAQCRAWYDGCNMCDRTADGVATCTHRSCVQHGKGFCRAYLPEAGTNTAG